MACMKLGSKADAFQRQGQAWFCATSLPSDAVVEVGGMSFHLHKFPLLSRSGVMERMIAEASEQGKEEKTAIHLLDIPGSARTFELIAKFCYGVKLELTTSNVVYLRCAAEHLEMSEDYGEGNLITKTETFLKQTVLKNWKDSLRALQTCDGILQSADELHITERCIRSLATKASTDPNLFGWPVVELGGPAQSPGGSILWNGISTGARPRSSSSGWWYEDVLTLSLSLYKRLIVAMESHGIRPEIVSGSIISYARKCIPGLNRHQGVPNNSSSSNLISEEDQKKLLEEIEGLLPMHKGLFPAKFLFGLLRTAFILKAGPACVSNLEKRIGLQLDEATLEDLLIPTFSNSMETLYDVDCMERVLEHFLAMNRATTGGVSPHSDDDVEGEDHLMGSPSSLTPVTKVAKLIDGYLAEVASDINLKLPKFQALAGAIPDYARPLDDGLYRATDIYLKSHPWLVDPEREHLCKLMDCQKLSTEACTHAAQNERLPLRIIVQVLFFEQLQLRNSIAGCLMLSENLDASRPLLRGGGRVLSGPQTTTTEGGWATAVRENQVLKVGMDSMKMRVLELEKECTHMRQEIKKLGRAKGSNPTTTTSAWGNVSKKLGFKLKSQMCSAQEDAVSMGNHSKEGDGKAEKRRRYGNGKHYHKILLPER